MPDRPQSLNIDEALKPAKPAVPEPTPTPKPFMERAREALHVAENMATGGAASTVGRATKNMNYGMGGSFNHAREDDH